MKKNPYLSIIIPFNNRIELLLKTINSIKTNDENDYEIILVDDGSQIDYSNVLSNYLQDNIHYFKINKSERGVARNYGAVKSNGQYLNFFDSDDICYSNHVSSFKEFVTENSFPKIFTNSYSIIDYSTKKKTNVILNGSLNNKIFKHNILSCNGVFINKNFFLENKFSENFDLSGSEDWDLWLRIANKENIIGNNIVTSVLNNHSNRSTKKQNIFKINKRLDILYERVNNKSIIKLNNNKLKIIISEIYSFKSLNNSPVINKKIESIIKLIISIYYRPSRIFEFRTYIIIKNLFFKFI